ncbi:MAG: PEP/pyruvate-binding domain-containing protein [Chthoniobacter sp.]
MPTILKTETAAQVKPAAKPVFIKWFTDIGIEDIPTVGGKNASLGEMYHALTTKGVNVPNGFAITADAYRYFLMENGLDRRLPEIFAGLDTQDLLGLRLRGSQARQTILAAPLPEDLEHAIVQAYQDLRCGDVEPPDVAVRSSATAEDLPDASFAGQQETYLNVRSVGAVLDACRRCFASLFTDRAISYRADKGYDHAEVALSVGVQRMVRSDPGRVGRDVHPRYGERIPGCRADQCGLWARGKCSFGLREPR